MEQPNDKKMQVSEEVEELLRQIVEQQNASRNTEPKPQIPNVSDSESEQVSVSASEFVGHNSTEFKLNIPDEALMQISEEDYQTESDALAGFEGLQGRTVEFHQVRAEEEFATRKIDLNREELVVEPRKKAESPKKKPKKKHRVLSSLVYLCVVLGVSVFASVFLINTARDLFGLAKPDVAYDIAFDKDISLKDAADALQEQGIIEYSLNFELYTKLRYEKVTEIPAGEYLLNSKMSYDELIIALSAGDEEVSTVSVTIPEGLCINEVADLLEENGVCSADDFRAAVNEEYGFAFEEEITDSSNTFYRLEGYIYPNTHEFYVDENPKSVVKRFLRDFQKNVMTAQYTERMTEMGMTLEETIILASIIQKEASNFEDMCMVSSVFHNRMQNNEDFPKLQSDVTYFYANEQVKPYQDIYNAAVIAAYDTYQCDGLPIGAITNPGREAIRAALYPDETSYYYFVTDENGKFYFASTLRGHEANIAEAEAVGGSAHGTATQGEDE